MNTVIFVEVSSGTMKGVTESMIYPCSYITNMCNEFHTNIFLDYLYGLHRQLNVMEMSQLVFDKQRTNRSPLAQVKCTVLIQ